MAIDRFCPGSLGQEASELSEGGSYPLNRENPTRIPSPDYPRRNPTEFTRGRTSSIELCVERFVSRYDEFPRSRTTINRRVKEATEQAQLTGRVYPHCLRATAASDHAHRGVPPVPLQALMGWSDLATAQKYVRISGTATADALRQVHHL